VKLLTDGVDFPTDSEKDSICGFPERKIQELLKQGWLLMSDLQSLSEERRAIVLGTAKGAGRATQE